MSRHRNRARARRPFPIGGLTLSVDEETGHLTDVRRVDPDTGQSTTLATADRDSGTVNGIAPEWASALTPAPTRPNNHPL